MAKSGGQPKAKKGGRKAKCANGMASDKPYSQDDLLRALKHELRREILRLMHASGEPLGPAQIERTLKLGAGPKDQLTGVSYHVRILRDFKIVSLDRTEPARGATEHLYASEASDDPWVRGLLKRTREDDEASLWPRGRPQGSKRVAKKKRR